MVFHGWRWLVLCLKEDLDKMYLNIDLGQNYMPKEMYIVWSYICKQYNLTDRIDFEHAA